MSTVITYRRHTIHHEPGFALPYRWLGTLCYATLEEAKSAIDEFLIA